MVLMASLVTAVGLTPRTAEAQAVSNGRIAFMRNTGNGLTDVASIRPSGRGYKNLTQSKRNELYVDVSPDGQTVAFTRFGPRGGDLFTVPIAGGPVTRLTNDRVNDEIPSWSWDGERIAFVRYPGGADAEIFVINSDGTGLTRVTDNDRDEADPRWSPDDRRLIYNGGSIDENAQDVYLTTIGEPGETSLTESGVNDSFAEWSPDGETVVYSSHRNDQWDLYAVTVEGLETTQLTNDPADDYAPRWSPNGAQVAFMRGRLEGNLPRDQVYVMQADGSMQQALSPARLDSFSAGWSPTGDRLVFVGQVPVRNDLPEWELFTVRPDGSDLSRLTRTKGEEFDPEWGVRST
jgi:Tol biopolymer transport system component